MLFRYILKHIKRSVFNSILFCLLLTLAGALLTLAAGLWYSVYKSEQDMEESVTTIAVVNVDAVRNLARKYVTQHVITEYESDWGLAAPNQFENWKLMQDAVFRSFVTTHIERDMMKSMTESV